jgi:disulfide oxidoreductase YuzD
MSKHNFFVKFLKKTNLFINSLLEEKLNKLNFLFETDKLLTFFSVKRIFGLIIVFFFIIFSYLFIPYTYNSNKLAAKIQDHLFIDLGINLNLSNNFTYNLFPKPNFVFKEIEFINEKKKFAKIQEMITYISFKNLFSVNKINIENIVLNKVNFDLNKNNYKFFTNILSKNFSNFDFEINNSKIIFKNNENDVLFINKINQLKYFFDSKDKKNTLTTNNEIFNIPYSVELKDYPVRKKNN